MGVCHQEAIDSENNGEDEEEGGGRSRQARRVENSGRPAGGKRVLSMKFRHCKIHHAVEEAHRASRGGGSREEGGAVKKRREEGVVG